MIRRYEVSCGEPSSVTATMMCAWLLPEQGRAVHCGRHGEVGVTTATAPLAPAMVTAAMFVPVPPASA